MLHNEWLTGVNKLLKTWEKEINITARWATARKYNCAAILQIEQELTRASGEWENYTLPPWDGWAAIPVPILRSAWTLSESRRNSGRTVCELRNLVQLITYLEAWNPSRLCGTNSWRSQISGRQIQIEETEADRHIETRHNPFTNYINCDGRR